MKILLAAIVIFTISSTAFAASYEKGDPKIGKALLEKSCQSCHAAMYNGDSSKIYTRQDRIVKTPQQLAARVTACSVNTNTGWFPEEEADVSAYLNQQYYKFK